MQLPDSFNGRQQQAYVNMRTGKLWQIPGRAASSVMSGINANLLLSLDNGLGGDQCGRTEPLMDGNEAGFGGTRRALYDAVAEGPVPPPLLFPAPPLQFPVPPPPLPWESDTPNYSNRSGWATRARACGHPAPAAGKLRGRRGRVGQDLVYPGPGSCRWRGRRGSRGMASIKEA